MKTIIGRIVSDAMQKTVVVEVTQTAKHPLYKRILTKQRRYFVDTGNHSVAHGDIVRIVKTRPLAKNKHFVISKIVKGLLRQEESHGAK